MFKEFKKFILRGNVVDLAVAVIIGAAFNNVVQSLVTNIITPIIAAIGGNPDFSSFNFVINGSKFSYGLFLNSVISFAILAAVVFFLVVTPINELTELATGRKTTDDPATKKCPECLSEIPNKATRCAFCTAKIG